MWFWRVWTTIFTGRPARSAAMPVLFLLTGLKMGFFAPQGRHVAPINVKVGTFIGANMWEYRPKNCQNFEFRPEICTSWATRLQYFYEIFSICTRL